MASLFPNLGEPELLALEHEGRRGEAQVYRACRDQLDDTWIVRYSLCIVTNERPPRDVEADFVLFHKDLGILVIEVKGGHHIAYNAGTDRWTSTDVRGDVHDIDPFRQAVTAKHCLLRELQESPRWRSLRIRVPAAHAVLFPEIDLLDGLLGPESKRSILGGRSELTWFAAWVRSIMEGARGDREQSPGEAGIAAIRERFCRSRDGRALLSSTLASEEAQRIKLTEQQASIFEILTYRPRAVITGGAGTGKTLLAMMRAQELARNGNQTLLLCFNAALGDHLKVIVQREGLQEKLHAMTFHDLCRWVVTKTQKQKGTDFLAQARAICPAASSEPDVLLPYALGRSVLVSDLRYDAILVDEAQDFRKEFWLPISLLLAKKEESLFYLFFDANQALYTKPSIGIIQDDPYPLRRNCRNTSFIHEAAYRFYQGLSIEPPPIKGSQIAHIIASTAARQAALLHQHVSEILDREKVRPEDIVVLIAPSLRKRVYYDLLRPLLLPQRVEWSFEAHRKPKTVLVDTVSRFKGLEAAVVLLWGLDDVEPNEQRELLYVALSRAKSRLYLVGTETAVLRVVQTKV